MTPAPTTANIVRTWGQCVRLSLVANRIGLLEPRESIERRTRMAEIALTTPIDLAELLDMLREQREYLVTILEQAGVDRSTMFSP